MNMLLKAPALPRSVPRLRRRLEIAALLLLIPLAIYLRVAPILAEHALARASLQDLQSAAQRQPQNQRVFYYLGLKYRQSSDLQQAERAFSSAAQRDGNDEASWIAWAVASAAIDRDEDAYKILATFVRFHPRSAAAHYALARLYQQNQAHRRAWEEASAAAKWDPNNVDAWRLSGEEAMFYDHLDEAEAAMRHAVALKPGDWRSQIDLGSILMARKQNARAVLTYRDAVRLAPQAAMAQLSLGRGLLSLARTPAEIDEARQSLLKAADLQPDLAPVHLLLGQSYVKQGRWPEAQRALLQAERLAPNNVDVAFSLSEVYRHVGNPGLAAHEARRHQMLRDFDQQRYALISRIELVPDDIGTRLAVARLCAAHDEYADARYFYRSVLARAPDNSSAKKELDGLEALHAPGNAAAAPAQPPAPPSSGPDLLQAGDACLALGDLTGARKDYMAAINMDRKCARAYEGMGLILNAQGHAEDAFLFLEHAIKINPRLSRSQYVLAQRYREAGFSEEATRRMEKVVRDEPGNAAYWYELAVDYGDRADVKSENAYCRAVELDPSNVSYLLDLADRDVENEKPKEAEAAYRRAITLAPRSSDGLSRLGGFLVKQSAARESQQEAQALLQQALALDPHNDFARYSLGRLELKQGHARQAIQAIEPVLAANPDIADAWFLLSRAYLRLGDRARSAAAASRTHQLNQQYQERVRTKDQIAMDPNNPGLHLKLARLSAKSGETARSILEYRVYLQRLPHDAAIRQEFNRMISDLKAKNRLPSMTLFNIMVAGMAHTTQKTNER